MQSATQLYVFKVLTLRREVVRERGVFYVRHNCPLPQPDRVNADTGSELADPLLAAAISSSTSISMFFYSTSKSCIYDFLKVNNNSFGIK